jgi:hypothetical protein
MEHLHQMTCLLASCQDRMHYLSACCNCTTLLIDFACQPHHSPISLLLQLHNIACVSYSEFFKTICIHIGTVVYIFLDNYI